MWFGSWKVAVVVPYRGHGKRWGRIEFANGFTLRAGLAAVHIWRPA